MAESFEISFLVGAAVRERKSVMNLGRFGVAVLFQALLAERVGVNVTVADALPRASVFSFGIPVPVVGLVLFIVEFLMFLAETSFGELWTAGPGAGCFRLVRHGLAPFPIKKPHGISPVEPLYSL